MHASPTKQAACDESGLGKMKWIRKLLAIPGDHDEAEAKDKAESQSHVS